MAPPMPTPPSEQVIDEARDLANRFGVRILPDGAIGIWSEDKGSKQITTVLEVLGLASQPLVLLDLDDRTPDRFKLRRGRETKGQTFDEWYAQQMNGIFRKHGKSGEPAQFTAKTMAHVLVECEGKC